MKNLLLLLFLVSTIHVYSQSLPVKDFDLQSLVDELLAIQDEDINYEELYENLAQLLSNPADVNEITEEQLRSLFILNEPQIQSFLKYREEAGPLLSVYELQQVEGITYEVFQKLIPFVTIPDLTAGVNRNLWKRIIKSENNYLILRYDRTLEEKNGFSDEAQPSSTYLGSPDRLYTRFRTSRSGDFSFGVTAEKDPGEKITWQPNKQQYGTDFTSYHAQIINKKKLKNLILGDYQAQFGQGITLGSAFGIGKNAEAVTTVRRSNLGFLPYTSLYEAGFFRGVAVSYSINKNITFHTMLSSRMRDGNISQDSDSLQIVSSLSYTGLHRTVSELNNKNALRETNLAGVLQFKQKTLDAGLLYHRTKFDVPLIRNATLYNQFYFQGTTNTNLGAYANYSFRNFAFFSEVSHTQSNGTALLAGILGSLTPALDISFLYRSYNRNYHSFYSNALAENTTPQNEKGIYWGWKYAWSKKYSFSGYVDLFRFPWLKFKTYAPSQGNEWLVRFNFKPSKGIALFAQVREETKLGNQSISTNLFLTAPITKRSFWLNADYAINARISFRSRAQFSNYKTQERATNGMMLLQDVTWSKGKISVSGRYALFDTDDYDNRLYVYEKDVWLAFSFPAYYGVGVRSYVLLQYAISKKIDVWLRWARTRYTDRETIGSGAETITGNIKNDIKFQTRIRL